METFIPSSPTLAPGEQNRLMNNRNPGSLGKLYKSVQPLNRLNWGHQNNLSQLSALAGKRAVTNISSGVMFPFRIFNPIALWQGGPAWEDNYGVANWRSFMVWTGSAPAWTYIDANDSAPDGLQLAVPEQVYVARTCGYNNFNTPILQENWRQFMSAMSLGNYSSNSGSAYDPAISELVFTAPPNSTAVFWLQWDTNEDEAGVEDYSFDLNEQTYVSFPTIHFGGITNDGTYFGDATEDNFGFFDNGSPTQLFPYWPSGALASGVTNTSPGTTIPANSTTPEGMQIIGAVFVGAQPNEPGSFASGVGANSDTGNDGYCQIIQQQFDNIIAPMQRIPFRGDYDSDEFYFPGEIVTESDSSYINATPFAVQGFSTIASQLSSDPISDGTDYSGWKNLFMPIGGGTGGSGAISATVVKVNTDGNTVECGGNVTSVAMTNNGTGYTSAPTVGFSGGGGSGAAGTAVLSGSTVGSVTITNMGSGYTSAPTVAFTGGGGSGAAGTAVLNNFSVALPPDLQKNTYDGKTVVLPNGTHVYAFVSAALRTDQTTLPDGTSPALNSAIWPPYLASTFSGTPAGWNTIWYDTPSGGTGVSGVAKMDTNRAARRWEVSEPNCYNGSSGFQLVPSASTGTDV